MSLLQVAKDGDAQCVFSRAVARIYFSLSEKRSSLTAYGANTNVNVKPKDVALALLHERRLQTQTLLSWAADE
jgi:hypothetical protein